MNSPGRGLAATGRVVGAYNRSYDNKQFVPLHPQTVGEYECIRVEPTDPSFFYRMDVRKPFGFEGETADAVFWKDSNGKPLPRRDEYFGIQPKDIMDAYKKHTNLYVVKPNTPIVLIDMGVLENVQRLLATAPEEYATSIRNAFPIVDGVVTRHSEPANSYKDKIDHDRLTLKYICTLPGIDGYYVNVKGLHPEIGLCAGSLAKLTVVDMFRIRAAQEQPARGAEQELPGRGTKRRGNNMSPNSMNQNSMNQNYMPQNSPNLPSVRRRIWNETGTKTSSGLPFGQKLNFSGGKVKRRTQRKRQTKRKQTSRK
jgi:hypothetical protein